MDRSLLNKQYDIFNEGCTYEVIEPFCDYAGIPYESGDCLTFIGSNFVPYVSGLSLFFDKKDSEIQIRLCVDPEFQQEIAHNLENYFCKL